MGKRRVIDSKIRTSQSFSALTYRQRDLWQGLIETADDQGRHPGVTAYIRSAVWPFDDVKLSEVEDDLLALELAGYIDRYEVDGMKYLQIIKWWHYQPMQWAGPSDYPAPPRWADRERYHGKGNEIIINNWDGEGGYLLKEESKVDGKVAPKVESKPPREVKGEVKGEGEGKGEGVGEIPAAFPAADIIDAAPQAISIERLVMDATGMPSIPPSEYSRTEQIQSLVDYYGVERVKGEFRTAYQSWINTKTKDGRKYRGTNFAWVDWAQDALAGNGASRQKSLSEMTNDEKIAYYTQQAQQQEAANG